MRIKKKKKKKKKGNEKKIKYKSDHMSFWSDETNLNIPTIKSCQ